MFFLKKLLSALVLPPAGPLLLALAGIWLSRRHPRTGRAVATVAIVGMLALAMPPVAGLLMHGLEDRPPIAAADLARCQAIVILGGGKYAGAPEYGGDTVGSATLVRVRYGAYLQRKSGLPILVTGGAPFGGTPEAATMKEAIERDFGGKVRWSEDQSRDTAENAAFSARMLRADGVTRIALVSQGWHLTRAKELFEREGLEISLAPTAYSTQGESLFERLMPSSAALDRSHEALHEWLGLLVQRLSR